MEYKKLIDIFLEVHKNYGKFSDDPVEHYDQYEQLAKDILAKYPEISIDVLEPVNIVTTVEILMRLEGREGGDWTEEISSNIWIVDDIAQTIRNVLNGIKPTIIVYKKPTRSVSPSSKAYEPVPFNKPLAKHSSASYARLFHPYI